MYRTYLIKAMSFCLLAFFTLNMIAQIPQGYYDSASHQKERNLKTSLSAIISKFEPKTYNRLWPYFMETDKRDDGSVWDMYSSLKQFQFIKEQCGNYKIEGDCYNREHSFPQSWFYKKEPMRSDLFHIYPTDGKVNGKRGDIPFGETDNPTYYSANKLSKLGPNTFPGYKGVVFEPSDEYKGDFARSYLYLATCYEDSVSTWKSPMLAGNSYPVFDKWAIDLLLKWCRQDRVSEKEKNRNEAVYKIQKNRNPFIDFPGLEEYIWGDKKVFEFTPDEYVPYADNTDTLSILSFNDFHGAFVKDGGAPGAGALVQTVLTEKSKNKTSLVVSAGDNFSGSYFSRITRGEPLSEMFRKMDVQMSAIGNHEFDWGQSYLIDTAAVYMNFIASNIKSKDGSLLKWLQPYKIVNQRLKEGAIVRIAFVGLTTTSTEEKTGAGATKGLDFINPEDAARVQLATGLKTKGEVDMVVLLMHIGTNMDNKDIIEEPNAKKLPWLEGVDAIISGHSHKLVLTKVNNVPIIQANLNGTHLGKLNFKIQRNGDDFEISYIGGDTIPVREPVDREIQTSIDRISEKYAFDEILTIAENDLIHDRNINKFNYTPVGAYVTASYADCFRKNKSLQEKYRNSFIIGVNHFGGIRVSILKGDVTKLRAGNVLPFGGNMVAYEFTGESLMKLLNDGRTNKNGYLQTSGLKFKLDKDGFINKITDISTKKEIKKSSKCVVVLDSFITTGGDGYDKGLFTNNEIKEFNSLKKEVTEAFINYLRELGDSISNEKAPLPVVQ